MLNLDFYCSATPGGIYENTINLATFNLPLTTNLTIHLLQMVQLSILEVI